ncbi:uncharacterized protein LOC115729126 [Rhodamnia argentea]|uniref:Uncharacterized protein LOC115729126 n=1 Tax=Rhodamnia argentea TaxID=178133 RepID=A0A8B8MZ92_9MYRT|nr:uncharacterized protein LOC115729126 [Rhodamnia argentea]XP_048129252.1 uncharacterized protein LOC115729126 [Rhodamnia argentea]
MAGGRNHPKYHHKPSNATASTASSYRTNTTTTPTTNKSRFESSSAPHRSSDPKPSPKTATTKPSPKSGPYPSPARPRPPPVPNSPAPPRGTPSHPFPDPTALGPPPPPSYGFHMLDRRTIVLADGSVRSYFALPPDYQDFVPPLPPRPLDPAAAPSGRFFPGAPRPELGGLPGPDAFRGGREELFVRGRQPQDYWNSLGLDLFGPGPGEGPSKRKFGGEGEDRDRVDDEQDKARKRQQVLQYGNPDRHPNPGPGGSFAGPSGEVFRGSMYGRAIESARLEHQEVDHAKLKKAFLRFMKIINENGFHRKNYLENGKNGPLKCVACGRSSKEFQDVHGLIMHAYNSENADLRVDHLGLHKALCALMSWNYAKPPDNSKAYQSLPAEEAAANLEDLIMWPPMVIIHNTITGKSKEGRMEGLGIKAMDNYVRELGFVGGKSKSLYGREGHLGITLIKFSADQSGLKQALQLAEHFEKDNHGRKSWARLQPLTLGKDDENNPNLVRVDGRTGEKRRTFYGYLGTALDIDKLDFDTRKKVVFESRREGLSSS